MRDDINIVTSERSKRGTIDVVPREIKIISLGHEYDNLFITCLCFCKILQMRYRPRDISFPPVTSLIKAQVCDKPDYKANSFKAVYDNKRV